MSSIEELRIALANSHRVGALAAQGLQQAIDNIEELQGTVSSAAQGSSSDVLNGATAAIEQAHQLATEAYPVLYKALTDLNDYDSQL
ncbi:hypothetical protein [Saccharopolyspora endophytica]|uniref:Uncharacterized protein n=1 Tax=Saccharopolyspora endophytica TaxID=543886 RepID=A0ABS5DRA2_9PSEU|nr:hypothetical protein [Saccharopolyspora endophytica]MBQ0928567.1 hypothetical protein [Saccharopolyspora endophytica]